MDGDAYEKTDCFRNWRHIGVPPQSGAWIYAQVWHIEFVLRHVLWACLRTLHGGKWQEVLRKHGCLERAKRWQALAKDDGVYHDEAEIPCLVWFLSSTELVDILASKEIRLIPDQRRKVAKEALQRFAKMIRNHWAHFRPFPPAEARKTFDSVFNSLDDIIAKWTADYWNPRTACEDEARWQALVKDLRDTEDGELIPILTAPVPGYHGGFLDAHSDDDRGLALLVQINSARSVLWVEPTAVGGSNNLGLQDAADYARKLGERAIHVALNFYKGESISSYKEDGFFCLRISLSLQDSPADLIRAIRDISEVTRTRGFKARTPRTEAACPDRGDQNDLTAGFVSDRLFYEAPWNVIIAPTQEGQKSWAVHVC